MAFVRKTKGGMYCVHQGNNGVKLSCHGKGAKGKKDAESRVRSLHKKFNPDSKNRGKSASKRDKKQG